MNRSTCLTPILVLGALLVTGAPSLSSAESSIDGIWRDVAEEGLAPTSDQTILPNRYRTLSIDRVALDRVVYEAPMEQSSAAIASRVVLSMPLPQGGFGRFRIEEAPIMAPELGRKYPEIQTYRGQGIDDPSATLRFSVTPQGFHGHILSTDGRIFIDPRSVGDFQYAIAYFTRDYPAPEGLEWQCHVDEYEAHRPGGTNEPSGVGLDLRVYRLALAATGEYTAFHGGTVSLALAAQVVAMNRINGVYETELALRMVIIANNDQIIYTDPTTDPYSNFNGFNMLTENQNNLDAVILNANYDIGHVFSTGGGGIASLRVPCVTGSKARGVTGLSSPTGDVFYIDFVAHEMGHQWGGNHTFNGSSGNCSGGNRNGSTAYEPGSGSTIQAYAGICSPQNLQSNSDAYFHGISLDEIAAYSRTGNGNNCPTTIAVGNEPPVVTANQDYTVPVETPFELCGSATDPDAIDQNALTYNWEEWDLGPTGHPNSPSGNAVIFRSFWATTSGARAFPRWDDIVNGTQTMGEILPTYARTMNFRLTARDNRAAGGTFGDNMSGSTPEARIAVADDSGPFLMTAPNGGGTWGGGTAQTVTWDVAGTDGGAVSCSDVSVLLSIDGGYNYPIVLVGPTPNDGSAMVTVPGISTTEARVMVRCADSVFFDISDGDFNINSSGQWLFGSSLEECDQLSLWDNVVR